MQKTVEVENPITQEELKARVARASNNYEFSWNEWKNMDLIAGNPFGVTDEQKSNSNWDMSNSKVWPDVMIDGRPLPSNTSKMGQQFAGCKSKTDVIKTAAHCVDEILYKFPQVASVITQASFIVAKVTEAFAFRVGIVESVAEDVLNSLDIQTEDRTIEQTAKDELNDIDIVAKDGRKWNVKFESQKSTDFKRIDVKELDNGKLKVKVEL